MAAEFLVVFTCNLLENTLEVGILWQEYLLNIFGSTSEVHVYEMRCIPGDSGPKVPDPT